MRKARANGGRLNKVGLWVRRVLLIPAKKIIKRSNELGSKLHARPLYLVRSMLHIFHFNLHPYKIAKCFPDQSPSCASPLSRFHAIQEVALSSILLCDCKLLKGEIF